MPHMETADHQISQVETSLVGAKRRKLVCGTTCKLTDSTHSNFCKSFYFLSLSVYLYISSYYYYLQPICSPFLYPSTNLSLSHLCIWINKSPTFILWPSLQYYSCTLRLLLGQTHFFDQSWSETIVLVVAVHLLLCKLPTYVYQVAFMQFTQQLSPLSSQWECFGVCLCVLICK